MKLQMINYRRLVRNRDDAIHRGFFILQFYRPITTKISIFLSFADIKIYLCPCIFGLYSVKEPRRDFILDDQFSFLQFHNETCV